MTADWLPPWALIIALQAVTASASIGRLTTSYYIVSRACNALALGAVAADFAIKYFVTGRGDDLTSGIVFMHRADDLTGLLVFSVLTLRTLLILCVGSLDRSLLSRRITCAVTFAVCVACTIAAQYIGIYPFRLVALLPAIGIGFACLGEASGAAAVHSGPGLHLSGVRVRDFGLGADVQELAFRRRRQCIQHAQIPRPATLGAIFAGAVGPE